MGLLIVRSDPGVGTFEFDRQKPGINSEAVTKSVPRGFLKLTLLEKGPCVRKLFTGLLLCIYPLKIKNIVLYCIEVNDREF